MQGGKDKGKQARLGRREAELREKAVGKAQLTELKEFEYEHPTTPGEKKDLRGAWPPAYNPSVIERDWYAWWSARGFFSPDTQPEDAPAFTMIIPPPNVTGTLHIGHALTNAVQDALARYYRQSGYRTEWLSGTDHAGISCQVVVEKQLAKQGLRRQDIGRAAFLEHAWRWRADYGGRICEQLRRLGSSLDWGREVFTLDAARTAAHDEAFARLFEAGLVYRDNRLVGWDCTLQTAISDVEVEYVEIKEPTQLQVGAKKYPFGYLWHFAYPVVPEALAGASDAELAAAFERAPGDFPEQLVFATTRPETMLGDSGLAVHPDDPRYAAFRGRAVYHPLRRRRIPVVADAVLVDMAFGTGVVKLTPAHDPNDFEAGRRHGLEFCTMLREDGRCASADPRFDGVPRLDARLEVIRAMQALGLYRDRTPNPMSVGLSQRSRDVVEPLLRPQWYIRCDEMARRALEAVERGELLITPRAHEATWRAYLGAIRPWCVSRQLWWGHQVPLYKVWRAGEPEPSGDATGDWVVGRDDAEAARNGCARLGCAPDELRMARDPDVTDTWFSSALFPFSAFGWPEATADLGKFFPGSVLETGYDILFFWVARMVMLSLQLHGKLPFREVLLHGMVRDSKGEKMSKSKGNVIDPLDCIEGASLERLAAGLRASNLSAAEVEKAIKLQKAEFPNGIPQCGTDALRLALCIYTQQAHSINLDLNKIVAQRNFCNKVYNAVKFAVLVCKLDQAFLDGCGYDAPEAFLAHCAAHAESLTLPNRFILAKLAEFVHVYHKSMRQYAVAAAAEGCVNFWWDFLCDVYIELAKPVLLEQRAPPEAQAQTRLTLLVCVDQAVRLLSVFAPFLCEEVFQRLPRWRAEQTLETIMRARLPADCRRFSFGARAEYEDYEGALWDAGSAYGRLRASAAVAAAVGEYEAVRPLVAAARGLRARYRVQTQPLRFHVQGRVEALSAEQLALFAALANAEAVAPAARGAAPPGCGSAVVSADFTVLAELRGLIDVAAERAKLEREAAALAAQRARLEALAAGPHYDRVPEPQRRANAARLEELAARLRACEELRAQYEAFE